MRTVKTRPEQSRKLIDQLEGEPAFGPLVAVLATTFDLTPDFVELDFLPSLVRVPAWDDRKVRARVQLEAELGRLDSVCLLQEASRFQGRPRSLRVHVTPAKPVSGGVLHAKVTLLVYGEAVRLVVGSANLTPSGYRENREIAVSLTASAKRREEAELVLDAVERMPTVLGAWWSPSAELVVSRAGDLLRTWTAEGSRPVDERFAWSDAGTALWPQFLEMWPRGESIERIRIVSPFWSEAIDNGPVPSLLRELRSRGARLDGARLELLTSAAMDAGEKGIPVLPASYGAFDFSAFGVAAFASAVKTRVDSEDVDRDDMLRERALHAKVVLLDGPKTRLAYVGSANFTAPGWGFTARSNIEAGMLIRRPRKDPQLESLVPPTPYPPVPLDGSRSAHLVAPQQDDGHLAWPSFLRAVELRPEARDPNRLELVVSFSEDARPTEWSLSVSSVGAPLVDQGAPVSETCAVPVDESALRGLLRQQAVLVKWSELGEREPVAFPVNVALAAREALPFGDPDNVPTERDLVAFYQGRISLEELFCTPEELEEQRNDRRQLAGEAAGVDTSKILSYQIRSFVESLVGLREELARNTATESTIRLSLLGPVSPLALAKEVRRAVDAGRSHTAAGFQLVELLRCLSDVREADVPPKLKGPWRVAMGQVRAALDQELTSLRMGALGADARFREYADAVLQTDAGEATP